MYKSKLISKKPQFESKFFKVTQMVVERDGKQFTKDFVERRDVVFILPLTEQNEIYLVSQSRDAVQEVLLETVAGQMDEGEDPLVAAKRELQEEAGLQASQWKLLETWYLSANMIGRGYIFLATGLTQGEASPEDDEDLEIIKISLEEAVGKALSGEINVMSSVAGILLLDRLKKEGKV